jgi:hypothetical protein
MVDATQTRQAMALLEEDRPDEDVERLTGLDLSRLIELRAILAATPQLCAPARPQHRGSTDNP